jgi:hypothetical protein
MREANFVISWALPATENARPVLPPAPLGPVSAPEPPAALPEVAPLAIAFDDVVVAPRFDTAGVCETARTVAGDVEKCLRDRERGAQFVGGVGCESLLFAYVGFEAREHGVEGVGEFAELVVAAL